MAVTHAPSTAHTRSGQAPPFPEPPAPELSPFRVTVLLIIVAGIAFGAWKLITSSSAAADSRSTAAPVYAPYVDVTLTPEYQFQLPSEDPVSSAYLGFIASFLRPEEMAPGAGLFKPRSPYAEVSRAFLGTPGLREGRFQKHLATVTLLGTFFSGFEALYSHYKNNFRYKAQWTPVIIAPLLMGAAIGAIRNPKIARTWLPLMSVCAITDGAVGFFYHARGVLRRPGGRKTLLYNILYGPPLFAPLLFAACGMVGILASLMRRERA